MTDTSSTTSSDDTNAAASASRASSENESTDFTEGTLVTKIPAEILQTIFSYLHPPNEEQRWSDKDDLKTVRSMCRTLRDNATPELFQEMTLRFTYTYDAKMLKWEIPRPVGFVKENGNLKANVRAVRLVVVPLSNEEVRRCRAEAERAERSSAQKYRLWQPINPPRLRLAPTAILATAVARLQDRLGRRSKHAPCTSNDRGNKLLQQSSDSDAQDKNFGRLFGSANGDSQRPVEEYISPAWPSDKRAKRQVFADYILCTLHALFKELPGLKHVEIGRPFSGTDYETKEGWEFISHYGHAFATAILCKNAFHDNIESLVVSPLLSNHADPPRDLAEVRKFCTQLLEHQLGRMSVRTLRISFRYSVVAPLNVAWKEALTVLELAEQENNEQAQLSELLSRNTFPGVVDLCLNDWVVQPETLTDKLPVAFPALKRLRLESLALDGRPKGDWITVIKAIKEKYTALSFVPRELTGS